MFKSFVGENFQPAWKCNRSNILPILPAGYRRSAPESISRSKGHEKKFPIYLSDLTEIASQLFTVNLDAFQIRIRKFKNKFEQKLVAVFAALATVLWFLQLYYGFLTYL